MFNFHNKKDIQIQKDVMNELNWDVSITSSELSAVSNNGIVTLRGTVPHFSEKMSAEAAVLRIGGVRGLASEVEVKLLGEAEREDDDIALSAINAFKWNYVVPKGIKVKVSQGWVTLSGEVSWDYQRNAAKDSVTQLQGVNGVTNDITLKPMIEVADVKKRIEEALQRSAASEGQKIKVDVQGSKVILSGNVHSFVEKQGARLAAWSAPGVWTIENNIKISE